MTPTTLHDLPTPCLLVEQAKFDRNVTRMRLRTERLGAKLRLHAKTNKSIDATRRIIAEGAPERIMVSTLEEARYFLGHGIRDITYGVGVAPQKIDAIARLMAAGAQLRVVLDNAETARALARRGSDLGIVFSAYIELDVDGQRAGVNSDDPVLIDIGRMLQDGPGTALAGVLAHCGGSYQCRTVEAIRSIAEQERRLTVAAAERLRQAGVACRETSVGSTPTATFGESFEGITEVRAGVYVFQDLVMSGLGVCGIEDVALSVLGTVIGHQKDRRWIIIDAGWMALSRDRGTASQPIDQGYGIVCDQDGRPIDDLMVVSCNQEHGVIADRNGGPVSFERLPIGARVRVLPNHACATAAQHDRYYVVAGPKVVTVWPRIGQW